MIDRPTHSTEKGNLLGPENNRVGHKVGLPKGHLEEPPWKNTASWCKANHTVAFLIDRHGNHLHETINVARNLYGKMISLFPLLEELCRATCTYCPDPCCFSAYAWFDFKDLLFTHLNGLAMPPAQLMTNRKMICRYLGVRGCTLERISRPWICSWYLCPAQKGVLRADVACGKKSFFHETATKIRDVRKKMETAFINETRSKRVEASVAYTLYVQ
jgi:hypothetical protein